MESNKNAMKCRNIYTIIENFILNIAAIELNLISSLDLEMKNYQIVKWGVIVPYI